MCGIVAYVGPRNCAPLLVDGLRRLEYRGYDSAGLAVHTASGVQVLRAVGKLVNLDTALAATPLTGQVGIGHTRWATHGRPTEINAHPHVSGRVAVVHNGIIENHVALRAELRADGYVFKSDTDTEIVAHLVERALARGSNSLLDALRSCLPLMHGAYALAVLDAQAPGEVVVAKQDSPLVLGVGEGESFAGSDVPAILPWTRDVIFLQDGELAVLRADGIALYTQAGERIERATKRIDWSRGQAEKGGYKHFMLKEVHEQPRAVEDTLRGRIDLDASLVVESEMGICAADAAKVGRVYFVGCGTSSYAASVARYWVEQLARLPSTVEVASEVRYRDPVFTSADLVVAVSQSGETADTLAAVKAAKAQGARILAVVNVLDSAIARASDGALYTHAGPEIGVASTKCFTAQLTAMLLLAVHLGRSRGSLSAERAGEVLNALLHTPATMREVLADTAVIEVAARHYAKSRDALFLGRGAQFPIALEGALKLKEISYIHAEGYAAGEMKHGPIALIDEDMPVIVLCPKDSHYEKTLSNMQEVKARQGQVIAVCTRGDAHVREIADVVFELPPTVEITAPLVTVIPLQLFSYYVADAKGTDVDQPRNLAKTVTVE